MVLGSSNQAEYNMQDLTGQQVLYITGTLESSNFKINKFLYNTPGLDPTVPFPTNLADKFSNNPTPGDNTNDRFNYLYMTNISGVPFEYCLQISPSEHGFVSDKSIITSIGSYGDTTLGLQAQAKKPLLEYIIRPYTE